MSHGLAAASDRSAAPSASADAPGHSGHRAIIAWLLLGCVLVAGMVVLGGVTRLTGSGLSMVDWEPVSGILPPMSAEAWQVEFDAYKESPQYRLVNQGMSLDAFKRIFWYEYAHRVSGRMIGVVFMVPFLYFLVRRRIPPGLLPRLLVILALGGAQGLLGWWMVKSGLVDVPRVSPYRLTAHLGLAVLVYCVTLWTALSLMVTDRGAAQPDGGDAESGVSARALARRGTFVFGLAGLTLLSGGFVAGLHAGLVYNTFPMMGTSWFPPELFGQTPWWRNFFEDPVTAQFDHRVLAMMLLAGVIAVWWWCREGANASARRWAHAALVVVLIQVGLGIATLLLRVPISLAVLHQANALLLVTALLGLTFHLRRAAR